MAALRHPLKSEIETVRRLILGADAKIGEGIKWNAPSFCTTEYFATTHLRSSAGVQLIFHLGAKVRKDLKEIMIADPAGMMKWLAKDRCLVTVGSGKEIAARADAFQAIIREWIKHV